MERTLGGVLGFGQQHLGTATVRPQSSQRREHAEPIDER